MGEKALVKHIQNYSVSKIVKRLRVINEEYPLKPVECINELQEAIQFIDDNLGSNPLYYFLLIGIHLETVSNCNDFWQDQEQLRSWVILNNLL